MRPFIITTESNSDLSPEYLNENHIGVIPHYYSVEEAVYGDGEELTIEEFYQAMRDQKKVATMASNPAVIEEMFTGYVADGYDILHVSFASALSGGFSNVYTMGNQVMEEHPGCKIMVVDTCSASLGEGLMIAKALEIQKAGGTIEEAAEWIEQNKEHIIAQFTVDDLNHLYRGGRLSRSSAILGTLVNIKPILEITKEGKLVPILKTRGRKKAMQTMLDQMDAHLGTMRDQQIFIGILHGDCVQDAQLMATMIKERFGYTDIVIRPIGPSIGAHSGPDALALFYLGDR